MNSIVPCLLSACFLLLAGCATPSSDPRQGGLIGYWSTGESGYQARLAERRQAIIQEQAAAERATQERAALETRKKEQSEALARLETQRAQMSTEVDGLEQEVAKLTELSAERTKDRDRLLAQCASVQAQMKALQGDPAANAANQEARLGELQTEVKALRQKASLLLGQ